MVRRRSGDMEEIVVDERDAARKRVLARRRITSRLVGFVALSAVLVVIWALGGGGYFWPGWFIGIVGVLLVLDAWTQILRRPLTEEDVDAELRRRRR